MSTHDRIRAACDRLTDEIRDLRLTLEMNLTPDDIARLDRLAVRASVAASNEALQEDASVEQDASPITARSDELISAVTSLYVVAQGLLAASTRVREAADNLRITAEDDDGADL